VITAADEQRVLDSVPHGLLIGGEWGAADGRPEFPVEDPSTGEELTRIADAGEAEARAAFDAAVAAQPAWAATAPRERGEILRRAFDAITRRADDLALLMTLEMGKPVAESRAEIAYGADFLRWFSEEAVRVRGSFSTAPAGGYRLLTMRRPVGPALLITPWNFPMAMATRKIGPAVAAGCTMVLKPAQQTPLSALALAAVLTEAGLPPGVLNVVTGSDAAALTGPILDDPRLRKLSFTGSTAVGRALSERVAGNLVHVSMELGGNAPFVVFDDADLDSAVDGAVIAKMRNMGEACTSANRFVVHDAVADEFGRRLAGRLGSMRVGRGTDEGVEVGPLIDARGRAKVERLVADASARGAAALTGGHRVEGPGYFFAPTVLAGVPEAAALLEEEIFGPVAPITAFATEEEGVALANATEYGLVSYVFTRDLGRALRVAEALETGMVGLNRGMVSNAAAPFGGVKQSGLGREGGAEGIDAYLQTKYVAVDV